MSDIAASAALLAPFWRRGRTAFVPLTAAELNAAGINKRQREALASAKLVSTSVNPNGITIFDITVLGIRAFQRAADGQEEPGSADPQIRRLSEISAAKRSEKFRDFLGALLDGPLSNRELAAATGRSIPAASDGTTELIKAGFVTRARAVPSGQRRDWTRIEITAAGRSWLSAQAESA